MKKKVNRRNFLKKTALTTSVAALSSLSLNKVKANKIFNWRMVTTWPKNFPGLGTGAETFARTVTEASGGRLNISVFGIFELQVCTVFSLNNSKPFRYKLLLLYQGK